MRILTLSLNAWNNTIATGNTFSNFFNNISSDDEIANIYCRSEKIDNNLCHKYFRITETDIVKSIFRFKACGVSFSREEIPVVSIGKQSILANDNTKGVVLRKKRPASLLFLREMIWSWGTWKNKKLKKFLKEVNPDVIYMHGHSNWYMHKLLWFCAEQTGAKVAFYSGDDVYAYHRNGLLQKLFHWKMRKHFYKTFTKADVVFGGSSQLCEEYSKLFGRTIHPLYKTCNNLKVPTIKKRTIPLQAVYSGNLLYGRDQVLVEMVKQIQIINKEELKIQLHIYSGTPLSQEYSNVLNDGKSCFYEGVRPFKEIVAILDQCDFSVFAESYNPEAIKLTRLSFSTKIIDYLESDSAIIVVGPQNIASIDYLKKSGVCVSIPELSSCMEVLAPICNNPELINEFVLKKYKYAQTYHSNPKLLDNLRKLVGKY